MVLCMLRRSFFITVLCCSAVLAKAQNLGFTLANGQRKVQIPFELYNNLIVVPVVLNDALPLNCESLKIMANAARPDENRILSLALLNAVPWSKISSWSSILVSSRGFLYRKSMMKVGASLNSACCLGLISYNAVTV